MVRFNIILLVAALLCSLSVVTSQHKARKIFQAMESEQERAKQLDVEFDQLQLELSTWATSPRIDKIAREVLKMRPAGSTPGVRPAGSPPAARPAANAPVAQSTGKAPVDPKPAAAKASGVAR